MHCTELLDLWKALDSLPWSLRVSAASAPWGQQPLLTLPHPQCPSELPLVLQGDLWNSETSLLRPLPSWSKVYPSSHIGWPQSLCAFTGTPCSLHPLLQWVKWNSEMKWKLMHGMRYFILAILFPCYCFNHYVAVIYLLLTSILSSFNIFCSASIYFMFLGLVWSVCLIIYYPFSPFVSSLSCINSWNIYSFRFLKRSFSKVLWLSSYKKTAFLVDVHMGVGALQ